MNKENLFKFFLQLKNKTGIEIVDTHIHPFDILGVNKLVYFNRDNRNVKISSPSFVERLEYRNSALYILKILFYLTPNLIRFNIAKTFASTNEERILSEMNEAGIDRGVLLPVAPFVDSQIIAQHYNSRRFIRLGSIDIHSISYEEIEKDITNQIQKFGIKGLKLHPNLQEFYPNPSRNEPELARKLLKIYKVAEDKKIYLLFHGGISYLINNIKRKTSYGILENFFDYNKNSEVFQYNIPIIIAHFGHYNITHPNFRLLHHIAQNYKNVFFDTSGVSPILIKKGIEIVGIKRVVFGSDALYFKEKLSLQLVLKSLVLADVRESIEERIIKIFSQNYKEKICNFL